VVLGTLGQKLTVGMGHQIRAKRHLANQGEPQLANRRHGQARVLIGEFRREAGRETSGHARAVFQQGTDLVGGAEDALGALAAHQNARSAPDTTRRDDLGLTAGDANGLGGTFAHAGVANPAALTDGADQA